MIAHPVPFKMPEKYFPNLEAARGAFLLLDGSTGGYVPGNRDTRVQDAVLAATSFEDLKWIFEEYFAWDLGNYPGPLYSYDNAHIYRKDHKRLPPIIEL